MNERTKDILRLCGLGNQVEAVEAGFCPLCLEPVSKDDLTSELYIKEYNISGMCQKCQDKVFEPKGE